MYVGNDHALRLYRRFGFDIEGTLRAYSLRDGEYTDTYAMAGCTRVRRGCQPAVAPPHERRGVPLLPVLRNATRTRPQAGRERAHCPACGWVHWGNPTPVVAALIEFDGKVLLARNRAGQRRCSRWSRAFWKATSHRLQAITREVAEETSLSTQSATLIGVYEFARKNEVIIAYHVQGEGEIRLGEELAEYRLIEPARRAALADGNRTGDGRLDARRAACR